MMPDLWIGKARNAVGVVGTGILHWMLGEGDVARLNLPALGITEILVEAPDNLNNEANRAQARLFTAQAETIRRVTAMVKAALPDEELANIEASMEGSDADFMRQ